MRGRPARAWAARTVLLLPAAFLALLGWQHRWNTDDAFINFRVVDHLVHGNGPVFNAGERVEAYTSALWLAVIAVPSAVAGVGRIEWIAVLLGLTLAVAGLALATFAAASLHRRDLTGGARVMLPLGAGTLAVLTPSWDFATSGLETGLGFAWLGGCYWLLVRAGLAEEASPASRRALWAAAWLAGLGPLVRPDFAIFAAGFLLIAVFVARRAGGPATWRVLALAIAVPTAYEIFRMGYFASLVPNTALAKEAGDSAWRQGATYVWDTIGTYWLPVPGVALLGWLGFAWLHDGAPRDRPTRLLLAVPVVMALLYALFLVRVGGDFMHGRLVLPALFAGLLPVAAIPVRRRAVDVTVTVVVVAWAAVCTLTLRPSMRDAVVVPANGIVDERSAYVLNARHPRPVTLEDYGAHPWTGMARAARFATGAPRVLTFAGPNAQDIRPDAPLRPGLPSRQAVVASNVGLFGFAVGRHVHVVDRLGLGDPVAARLRLDRRGRPGHEKFLSSAWAIARYGDVGRLRAGARTPDVLAGLRAQRCGNLRRTLEALTASLTVGRFLRNVAWAPRATRLRIAVSPRAAARDVCG